MFLLQTYLRWSAAAVPLLLPADIPWHAAPHPPALVLADELGEQAVPGLQRLRGQQHKGSVKSHEQRLQNLQPEHVFLAHALSLTTPTA